MRPPTWSVRSRPNLQCLHQPVAIVDFFQDPSTEKQYLELIMHPHLHTKNALGMLIFQAGALVTI